MTTAPPPTPRPRRGASAVVLVAALAVLVGLWCALCIAGWSAVTTLRRGTAEPSAMRLDRNSSRGSASAPAASTAPGGGGAEGPRDGGTLRLPGDSPLTLDPALVGDVTSAEYIYEVFSGLVTLSPELEVVPDLAADWDQSADGTVFTFTLRSDALFHDGTPVTPEDVAFAIERACDPATGSTVAETYLGDVVGCVDKLTGRTSAVAGARVLDPRRLELTIDAPKAYFLPKLTYPTSFVVDRRQVATDPRWLDAPNGTGAFRLTAYVEGETLTLERADAHAGAGGAAHLDAVVYDLRPIDPLTRYENGELDATPVGGADVERVRDPLGRLASEVVEGSGDLDLSYIGFNVTVSPFDDVHVRRALSLALDKRRLADIVLDGAALPVDTILPPGMPGFDADLHPYPHDADAARAELSASRFGGPAGLPAITLDVPGEGGGAQLPEAVADQLSATLGISVTVEQTPWATYQAELDAGAYDMFMLGWAADYADPQDFLDVLFHGRSPMNHSMYADAEVDTWLEAARVERDEDARLALYAQAERRILDDAVWIPLYTGVDTWLVAPYVREFALPPVVVPRMARVWLAEVE